MKITRFNRENNGRLRLNWQCIRLHFIFGGFNRLRLLKKTVIDYDYPMSDRILLVCGKRLFTRSHVICAICLKNVRTVPGP